MGCFLMQDWVTIRGAGASSVESVTQMSECWLDMEPFQDINVWIAIREITPPVGAGTLYLDIQTAPVRDELYFLSMIGGSPSGQALTTASGTLTPIVLNLGRDFAALPVSRWVRWKLTTGGTTPTQVWDATFSIWIAANFRIGSGARGARRSLPGKAPVGAASGNGRSGAQASGNARILLPPSAVWLGRGRPGSPNGP
jgi:hypothetical protein